MLRGREKIVPTRRMFRGYYDTHISRLQSVRERLLAPNDNKELANQYAELLDDIQFHHNEAQPHRENEACAVLAREDRKKERGAWADKIGLGPEVRLFDLNCCLGDATLRRYYTQEDDAEKVLSQEAKIIAIFGIWAAAYFLRERTNNVLASLPSSLAENQADIKRVEREVELCEAVEVWAKRELTVNGIEPRPPLPSNGGFVNSAGELIKDPSDLDTITEPLEWVPQEKKWLELVSHFDIEVITKLNERRVTDHSIGNRDFTFLDETGEERHGYARFVMWLRIPKNKNSAEADQADLHWLNPSASSSNFPDGETAGRAIVRKWLQMVAKDKVEEWG